MAFYYRRITQKEFIEKKKKKSLNFQVKLSKKFKRIPGHLTAQSSRFFHIPKAKAKGCFSVQISQVAHLSCNGLRTPHTNFSLKVLPILRHISPKWVEYLHRQEIKPLPISCIITHCVTHPSLTRNRRRHRLLLVPRCHLSGEEKLFA